MDFGQPSWGWGFNLFQKFFSCSGKASALLICLFFFLPTGCFLKGEQPQPHREPGFGDHRPGWVWGEVSPGSRFPGAVRVAKGSLPRPRLIPPSGSWVAHCADKNR